MSQIKTYGLNAGAERIYFFNPTFTSERTFYSQRDLAPIDKLCFSGGISGYKGRKPFNLNVDGENLSIIRYIPRNKMALSKEVQVTKKLKSFSEKPYLFESLYDLVGNWIDFCLRAGNGEIAFSIADYQRAIGIEGKTLSPFDTIKEVSGLNTQRPRAKVNHKELYDAQGELYISGELQKIHRLMRKVKSLPITKSKFLNL